MQDRSFLPPKFLGKSSCLLVMPLHWSRRWSTPSGTPRPWRTTLLSSSLPIPTPWPMGPSGCDWTAARPHSPQVGGETAIVPPLTYIRRISPATKLSNGSIHPLPAWFAGQQLVALGWGTTAQGSGSLSQTLQQVTVGYVSTSQCRDLYSPGQIQPGMLCAGEAPTWSGYGTASCGAGWLQPSQPVGRPEACTRDPMHARPS